MKRTQLAIIGNGMAAGKLLDELLRRDALNRLDITVFGEEPHGCYNRILLNRVLQGESPDEITLKPLGWYADRGVRLISGQPVTRLSAASHRLWTADGQEHYFDQAVFATGSIPRLPLADGFKRPDGEWKQGLAPYRTLADCERIRDLVRSGCQAVVIGGGLLGIEAAKGLHDLGATVTIVHLFDTLMNRQLDTHGAAMLRRAIEALGIHVRTSATTKAFEGNPRVQAVRLGDGTRIPADVVVLASGVKPRIDLAQDSDIPTNAGILVDDQMRTSINGIYAVGECAEHNGQIYGIVQPVYEQCSVLADVLAGTRPHARYTGSKLYTRLKVVGVEVASMGDMDARHGDDEVVQIIEERRGIYRKLIIREDRLAGAVLVGDTTAAGSLIARLERGDKLPANRLDVFVSPDWGGDAPTDTMICKCNQVSEVALQEAFQNGCRTLSDIAERTGAGTGCGSCRGPVAALLLKHAKQVVPTNL